MAKLKPKPKTEFEKLRDKWYKKLESDGFQDIEQNEERLKSWSSQLYIHSTQVNWEAKAAYYQMASNFLEDYKFKNKLEQIVWEYHANGLSFAEIAKILRKAKVAKYHRASIGNIITSLKMKMYDLYMVPMKEYHE